MRLEIQASNSGSRSPGVMPMIRLELEFATKSDMTQDVIPCGGVIPVLRLPVPPTLVSLTGVQLVVTSPVHNGSTKHVAVWKLSFHVTFTSNGVWPSHGQTT